MARGKRSRDLFTASQIAKYCQVDLKTIHNWADRGEINHFRTPGRHLRFRRHDVLDFLRKYGYPIPDDLADGRPRVALLIEDDDVRERAAAMLSSLFDVTGYKDPVDAMLQVGERPPDAVVLGPFEGAASSTRIIAALKRNAKTQHIRAVVMARHEERDDALDAGASAHVLPDDPRGLRDTLEALLGVSR